MEQEWSNSSDKLASKVNGKAAAYAVDRLQREASKQCFRVLLQKAEKYLLNSKFKLRVEFLCTTQRRTVNERHVVNNKTLRAINGVDLV